MGAGSTGIIFDDLEEPGFQSGFQGRCILTSRISQNGAF